MQGLASKSVLVVEDDAATAAFLADNLRADGFAVWCASAVPEALRALELRQPDVLLLDLGLEDGSGFEVLDRVRAADVSSSRIDPDLPVIVLTGPPTRSTACAASHAVRTTTSASRSRIRSSSRA